MVEKQGRLVEQQGRSGLTRRHTLAVAVAAASLVLAGCAAGQHAQTVSQVGSVDGVSADSGTVGIRAAGLATPSDGKSWAAGADVPLELVLINNGTKDDTLTGITSDSAADTAVSGKPIDLPAAGSSDPVLTSPLVIGAGKSVHVGLGVADAEIMLRGIKTALFPSQTVPVTFVFKSGAKIDATLAVKLSEGGKTDPTLSVSGGE